jgi:hypothetical protein
MQPNDGLYNPNREAVSTKKQESGTLLCVNKDHASLLQPQHRTGGGMIDTNSTHKTYSTFDLPVRRQSAMKRFSRFGFAIAF